MQNMQNISRQSYILSIATQMMGNPDMMRKHFYKSQVCQVADCIYDGCDNAHFIEEYRPAVCIFLEFCQNSNCNMYHPHLGSPYEYTNYIGISNILMTRDQWELKKQRNMIHVNARKFMSDKELLRQHLFKTRPCFYGSDCKNKEKCAGAHSIEEYKLPICLFMNFCEEEKCQHFHHRDDKEKFFENFRQSLKVSSSASLYEKEEKTVSLKNRNLFAIPNKVNNQKTNTRFCNFVKENSLCTRTDCKFAHSLEDLVISLPYSSIQEKKELVEKINGSIVDEVFLKKSYENSTYFKMMKEQVDVIEEMKDEKISFIQENKYDSEEEIVVQIDCSKISDLNKWNIIDGSMLWGDIDD